MYSSFVSQGVSRGAPDDDNHENDDGVTMYPTSETTVTPIEPTITTRLRYSQTAASPLCLLPISLPIRTATVRADLPYMRATCVVPRIARGAANTMVADTTSPTTE